MHFACRSPSRSLGLNIGSHPYPQQIKAPGPFRVPRLFIGCGNSLCKGKLRMLEILGISMHLSGIRRDIVGYNRVSLRYLGYIKHSIKLYSRQHRLGVACFSSNQKTM